MRLSAFGLTAVLGLVGFAIGGLACSSDPGESMFKDEYPDTSGSSGGNQNPFGGTGSEDGGDGTGNGGGDGAACATANAGANLTPVDMVVMYDRSGSMGDTNENPSYDPAKKWIPVGQAMKAFFKDPGSAGLNAALTFFADTNNSCTAGDYTTAVLSLRPLPDQIFADTIDATRPKGDTPTKAAMAGAISQAQSIQSAHPTDKTVIVLVTDGEPYGCGISTSQQSNAEAQVVAQNVAAVAASIPTYVIGIGLNSTNLNAIATAGGTTAIQVPVDPNDAANTSTALLNAMKAIRGNLASCDFDIPPPPDGRQLDFDKVYVEFTPAGQPAQTLAYSADCSDKIGWRFDNPNAPKKILLCDDSCNAVKSNAGGKVNVAFACTDRPDVIH